MTVETTSADKNPRLVKLAAWFKSLKPWSPNCTTTRHRTTDTTLRERRARRHPLIAPRATALSLIGTCCKVWTALNLLCSRTRSTIKTGKIWASRPASSAVMRYMSQNYGHTSLIRDRTHRGVEAAKGARPASHSYGIHPMGTATTEPTFLGNALMRRLVSRRRRCTQPD